MNIVFMGTPEFAVPSLESLVKEGHNIGCVVTQPDKPRGRGKKVSFSPVKEEAIKFGIPVAQPSSIRKDRDFIEQLVNMQIDIIVVVAFGQILPLEVLSVPKYGCINVHASLLPELRGAAPINWSIINGCSQTGVTTMFMEEGLDTGDMLLKDRTSIEQDETAGELHDRLKIMGARTLIKTIKSLEDGTLKRISQDDSQSSYAPMMNRETGKISWDSSSANIKNLVRGTNPWPVSYTVLNGNRIRIWSVDIEKTACSPKRAGQIWKIDKEGIHVYTGDGGIIIKEVQGESGKRTDAYSYTLGHEVTLETILE